jgi:predicted AlkP superfamily pyrophosphatase or phosphodiesterase
MQLAYQKYLRTRPLPDYGTNMLKSLPHFRILLRALIVGGFAIGNSFAAPVISANERVPQPKLIVVLVVDGLPNEQVLRYRDQFGQGGFRRMLEQGASLSNAHQAHGITVTAVGHATILSGAYPYQHGVIGNNWIDPKTYASVYCTEDTAYRYISEETKPSDGTSPANMRVDTLGDQLRYASGNRAKVVAVSGKDRGAILLAGKSGTAYMYMEGSGNFASSTYYMQSHPDWVQRYQSGRPQDRYYGKKWTPLLADSAYATDADDSFYPATAGATNRFPFTFNSKSGSIDSDYFKRLKTSPFLDELTLEFARAAVQGERLGNNPNGVTDLLAVSLSAHDSVNHSYGPESKMSHDHLQRLDRMLAGFFDFLDQSVGRDNFLVVLTADHGFANTAEFSKAQHLDAGRINSTKLVAALNAHLSEKYKLSPLVRAASLPNIYLDSDLLAKRGLAYDEVERTAARFLRAQEGIAEVYSRSQFESGAAATTRIGMLMRRAWNSQLSGDLMVVTRPHWAFGSGSSGATHGTPYKYDTNVPLMLMGPRWIKPGFNGQYAETVDIAPTLASVLRIRPPAGSEGKVLTDILRAP